TMQAPDPVAQPLRRVQANALIVRYRVPRIAEFHRPPQRRRALTANPDWQMRLRGGFWCEHDVGELRVFAVERWLRLIPQGAPGSQVLIGNCAALFIRRRAKRLELLAHPTG